MACRLDDTKPLSKPMLECCLLDPQEQLKWKLKRNSYVFIQENAIANVVWKMATILYRPQRVNMAWTEWLSARYDRKWQDCVYIQCEYKSTKQKIKHLLREEIGKGKQNIIMWGIEICKIYSKIMKKYHHCVKFTYPLSFQTRIPKVDQHTGGKWLIHGTKHRKDNQLQSLELSCRIS